MELEDFIEEFKKLRSRACKELDPEDFDQFEEYIDEALTYEPEDCDD